VGVGVCVGGCRHGVVLGCGTLSLGAHQGLGALYGNTVAVVEIDSTDPRDL
jgi:hypothetical protein